MKEQKTSKKLVVSALVLGTAMITPTMLPASTKDYWAAPEGSTRDLYNRFAQIFFNQMSKEHPDARITMEDIKKIINYNYKLGRAELEAGRNSKLHEITYIQGQVKKFAEKRIQQRAETGRPEAYTAEAFNRGEPIVRRGRGPAPVNPPAPVPVAPVLPAPAPVVAPPAPAPVVAPPAPAPVAVPVNPPAPAPVVAPPAPAPVAVPVNPPAPAPVVAPPAPLPQPAPVPVPVVNQPAPVARKMPVGVLPFYGEPVLAAFEKLKKSGQANMPELNDDGLKNYADLLKTKWRKIKNSTNLQIEEVALELIAESLGCKKPAPQQPPAPPAKASWFGGAISAVTSACARLVGLGGKTPN